MLVSAHRFSSVMARELIHAQDFDDVRRRGCHFQISVFSQEGGWMERAACVNRLL